MKHTSIMASLAYAFQIPLSAPRPSITSIFRRQHQPMQQQQQTSPFSSTNSLLYRRYRRKRGAKPNPKMTVLRYSLYHPTNLIPSTLKLSRNRTLRHWTIMRAWSTYLAQKRERQNLELERQWNSMRSACEELRVGISDGGRLFRQAMTKKGLWGGRSDLEMHADSEGNALPGRGGRVARGSETGIPIEYGRGLTDFPPRDGWNESWTR